MINLLPPAEKIRLEEQQKKNVATVFGIIAVTFFVSLALVLYAVNFYMLGTLSYHQNAYEQLLGKIQTPGFIASLGEVKSHNANLSRAQQFYANQKLSSEAVEKILGIELPAGIVFSSLSLAYEGGFAKVNIEGISQSREGLVIFKERLENYPGVARMIFPASNWIKSKDIYFTVSFDYED